MVIPGGFGARGIEGKIAAARYAREEGVPCLGLCLGLHCMTIEFARNVLGLADANSTEFDPTTQHPVIDLMHDQRDVTDKGGTMRLGAYYAVLHGRHQGRRRLRRARRQRAPPPPLRVQLQLQGAARGGTASSAAGSRRTAGWSSSSSWPTTRSGSARRPTRSSRAGPDRPHPLFRDLIGAALKLRAQRGHDGRPSTDVSFRHLGDREVHQGHIWRVVVAEFEDPGGQSLPARHRPLARRGRRRAAAVRRRGQPVRGPRRAVPPGVRPGDPGDPGRDARRPGRTGRDHGPARARRGGRPAPAAASTCSPSSTRRRG